MNVSVSCKNPRGKVRAIPSKSIAHRALICAALSEVPTELVCDAMSQDIDATVRCIEALGARVERKGGSIFVARQDIRKKASLNCGESGSTLRFLIPVAAALDSEISFSGSGRLPSRPISPLLKTLAENGAEFEYDETLPLVMRGGLESGVFKIPGDISSQFISGLIFALPLLSGDSEIQITGKVESGKYIDMTLDVVSRFGIEALRSENKIYIKGNQTYTTPGRFSVEGDWSNAAFWAALGAFSEEGITCNGVNIKSVQGDCEILDILERFGAKVTKGQGSFSVKRGALSGTEVNAAEVPDLVPIISVVASVADGKTVISNVGRLRIKESDRIATTEAMIKNLGGQISANDDEICIIGKSRLSGGKVFSENDHRIAMSAAVAAAVSAGEVTIFGAEAVRKSYGNFFEEYEKLGCNIKRSEG